MSLNSQLLSKLPQIETQLESIQRLDHERVQNFRTESFDSSLKELNDEFNVVLSFRNKSNTLRTSIAKPNLNPEQQQVKKARQASLREGMEKIHELENLKGKYLKALLEIKKASKEIQSPTAMFGETSDITKKISMIERYLNVLIETNNEAYYGFYLSKLKGYKSASNKSRIVETNYVVAKEDEVLTGLTNEARLLIHGPFGSGKTDMAIEAAYKYHKLLFGKTDRDSKFEVVEEENINYKYLQEYYNNDIPEFSQDELDKFLESGNLHPEDEETETLPKVKESTKESQQPFLLVRGSGRTEISDFTGVFELIPDGKGAMESKFRLGALYRAIQDGLVLIIDEFNAIPPAVLFSLNDILQRAKVGSTVEVQENPGQRITVKEGFGIIFTGNLPSESNGVVGRQVQDAAFLSRFEPIEYGFLPQSKENDISKVDVSLGGNEIWEVMMSKIVDRNGFARLVPNAIEDIWKFAAFSSYIQGIYSGSINDTVPVDGEQIVASEVIKGNSISWREINRIFQKWINSGCVEKLGSVIHRQLDTITDPTARNALKQLLESKYGMSQKQANYDMQYSSHYTPREIVDRVFGKPDVKGAQYYHRFISTTESTVNTVEELTIQDAPRIEYQENISKPIEEVWREVFEKIKDIKIPTAKDRDEVAKIIGCNPFQVSITAEEAMKGGIIFHIGKIVLASLDLITPAFPITDGEGNVTIEPQSIAFPKMMSGKLMLPRLSNIDGLLLPEVVGDLDLRSISDNISNIDMSRLLKPIKIMKFQI